MDEEKKGFNLSVLISLLVGVISLIVIIPSISIIMNKATEVAKPEEYRIIVSKYYDFSFDFNDEYITQDTILSTDLSDFENLISLSADQGTVILTLSYPFAGSIYHLHTLSIYDDIYNGEYDFTYLDPVSNDKLYGTYDFSKIILTEDSQVLNPIYTPF